MVDKWLKEHPQKEYCFKEKCFEVDKELKSKHLNDINKNKNIHLYGVCAGHPKEPANIKFFGKVTDLCKLLEKQIPNTECEKTDTEYTLDRSMISYSITSKSDDYKKWWVNASKVLSKISGGAL